MAKQDPNRLRTEADMLRQIQSVHTNINDQLSQSVQNANNVAKALEESLNSVQNTNKMYDEQVALLNTQVDRAHKRLQLAHRLNATDSKAFSILKSRRAEVIKLLQDKESINKLDYQNYVQLLEILKTTDAIVERYGTLKGRLAQIGEAMSGIDLLSNTGKKLTGLTKRFGMLNLAINTITGSARRGFTVLSDQMTSFHSETFELLGTMSDLTDQTMETANANSILEENVRESYVALSQFRQSRDVMDELSKSMTQLEESFGVSQEVTAKLAARQIALGKSTSEVELQFANMRAQGINLRLTGESLAGVTEFLSNNIFMLHQHMSELEIVGMQQEMFKLAAAAQSAGISIGTLTNHMDQLLTNRDRFIPLLGADALELEDPTELMNRFMGATDSLLTSLKPLPPFIRNEVSRAFTGMNEVELSKFREMREETKLVEAELQRLRQASLDVNDPLVLLNSEIRRYQDPGEQMKLVTQALNEVLRDLAVMILPPIIKLLRGFAAAMNFIIDIPFVPQIAAIATGVAALVLTWKALSVSMGTALAVMAGAPAVVGGVSAAVTGLGSAMAAASSALVAALPGIAIALGAITVLSANLYIISQAFNVFSTALVKLGEVPWAEISSGIKDFSGALAIMGLSMLSFAATGGFLLLPLTIGALAASFSSLFAVISLNRGVASLTARLSESLAKLHTVGQFNVAESVSNFDKYLSGVLTTLSNYQNPIIATANSITNALQEMVDTAQAAPVVTTKTATKTNTMEVFNRLDDNVADIRKILAVYTGIMLERQEDKEGAKKDLGDLLDALGIEDQGLVSELVSNWSVS